ncbi:hypothetical protein M2262_001799 [Pseudomonas sp. BIGb0408]|uniref:CENP-V/GFA domain-containing protein n=1 Tax=Phytopseudomonas flavescens TaxID=29435 RepID=A0A7Y9XLN8_9GAMM|nr:MULTISPECIES: GFA family protein [Pseudomonas]MCW2291749.1 hypothetical protein [Pseudomonas sp. BIGb0408]NYH73680.1 hypothetical protein [Pseudomonas flavescens]
MAHLEKHGSCLCGAVSLTLHVTATNVSACHCTTCRKWGGGPLLVVEGETAHFTGQRHVRTYASSEWAERAFCVECGTHLFYRLTNGGFYAVPVGLLDGDENWQFESQVFIDAKPAYYCFANQTRELTGEQLFAHYKAT